MYSIIPIQKIMMRILLYSIDVYVNIDMYMYVDEEYIDINMNILQKTATLATATVSMKITLVNISWR